MCTAEVKQQARTLRRIGSKQLSDGWSWWLSTVNEALYESQSKHKAATAYERGQMLDAFFAWKTDGELCTLLPFGNCCVVQGSKHVSMCPNLGAQWPLGGRTVSKRIGHNGSC